MLTFTSDGLVHNTECDCPMGPSRYTDMPMEWQHSIACGLRVPTVLLWATMRKLWDKSGQNYAH